MIFYKQYAKETFKLNGLVVKMSLIYYILLVDSKPIVPSITSYHINGNLLVN